MEKELKDELRKIKGLVRRNIGDTLVIKTQIGYIEKSINEVKGVEKEVKILSEVVINNKGEIKNTKTEIKYIKWVFGSIFLIVAIAGTILKVMK